MHGVDDVKEVLHDGHALQRRVGPGYAIYTLNERAGAYTRFNLDYVRWFYVIIIINIIIIISDAESFPDLVM